MNEQLHDILDKLKLRGIAGCLNQALTDAERQGLAIQDVLYGLLTAEHQHQISRAMEYRLKRAKIPWDWALDTFPFKEQPVVNRAQIMSLAKLDFIRRRENITFIGSVGAGKTGLAIGLLREALINGYRGRFYKAQDLLDELYTSLADRTTSSQLKTLSTYDILVVDELGYLTLTPEQINMFFKLIDMRYDKCSTIITTNLDYSEWHDIFKNRSLVDAMVDRFKHHCTTITINGPSLRATGESIGQEPKPLASTRLEGKSIGEEK